MIKRLDFLLSFPSVLDNAISFANLKTLHNNNTSTAELKEGIMIQ